MSEVSGCVVTSDHLGTAFFFKRSQTLRGLTGHAWSRAVSRVALMTSGGDSPGMNAALRASTVLLKRIGIPVEGIMYGYKGLLERRFKPLGSDQVARILRDGGTILGSARDKSRAILAERGIDGLIVIGGNGSLTGANFLAHPDELGDQKLTAVGIPASIDNDIGMTGQAIGVDTAMNTIVDACDKIADTASAFDRTFVIEVMGRDCGYLAMTAGVASGADAAPGGELVEPFAGRGFMRL